jgi:hypothetical protein
LRKLIRSGLNPRIVARVARRNGAACFAGGCA